MDPHNFIARAEAQRWLGIAEKLLIDHDLVGSKTFAIRARESDPRLEPADQILAIADTLLAAEKRVVGNNGVHQPDFYAILQLVRFAQDTDHIASQYRRLAVMLNPHQNPFPYSDQAFQVVNDAWIVLSDPMRKSMYDSDLDFPPPQHQMNTIGFNLDQHHHHHHQQQQEQHNFFSINHMESDHEQDLPEPHQPFQITVERNHQQQQLHPHNFLSQNPVRSVPFRDQEQLFQPQIEPLEVTSTPHQQHRPPPMHSPTPPPPPPAAPPQPPFSWPETSPLSQPQQPQQNVGPVHPPNQANCNNGAREEETEATDVDKSPTFWTACPYCFYMYEYSWVYEECTLRCNNCKRAYQAVRISSPPSMVEGKEDYYYCWGYFPLGVSISHLPKNNGSGMNSKWTPFSPLHDASGNVLNHLNSKAAPKKKTNLGNKNSGPRIYIDDETDDIFTGISEPSDDSDVEWNSTRD